MIVLLALAVSVSGQSPPSIQGSGETLNESFRAGSFARLRVQLEGNTLSLTPIERSDGEIAAGVTSRYIRVE
jgi:hypothetical protein